MGGFVSLAAFVFGSWIIGYASEQLFPRRLKKLLVLCTVTALLCTLVFALAVPSPVAPNGLMRWRWLHFASITMMSAAVGGIFPVSIELAAEQVYPVEESTVAGACQGINCLAGAVYLLAMDRVPNVFVNGPMLAGTAFSLVLLASSKERYGRRDFDEGVNRQKGTCTTWPSSASDCGSESD